MFTMAIFPTELKAGVDVLRSTHRSSIIPSLSCEAIMLRFHSNDNGQFPPSLLSPIGYMAIARLPRRIVGSSAIPSLSHVNTETTQAPKTIEELWQEYFLYKNPKTKRKIAEHYFHLVHSQANRLAKTLVKEVDPEDLMQNGFFGLYEAIENFDPRRGIKFETFSQLRIRGSMLDELREEDEVSRTIRTFIKKRESFIQTFRENNKGINPSNAEIAEALDLSMETYQRYSILARHASFVSLQRERVSDRPSGKTTTEADYISDPLATSDPSSKAQADDFWEFITKELSRRERLILKLYYIENMSMEEVGTVIGLTQSRISQMHLVILDRFKARLAKDSESRFATQLKEIIRSKK